MKEFRNNLSKYVKNYKFNSIFIRNLAALMILIIIPLIAVVIISYFSYNNLQQKEIKSFNESYIAKLSNNADRIIRECKYQINYIAQNSEVELFMYSSGKEDYINFNYKYMFDLIRIPIISKDYINSIYIYANNSNRVVSQYGLAIYDDFSDKECLEPYLALKEKTMGNWMMITENRTTGVEEKQLSIYYNINYGSIKAGTVVVNVNLKAIEKQLELSEKDKIYLTYSDKIIYSSNTNEIGKSRKYLEDYVSNRTEKNKNFKRNSIESKTSKESGIEYTAFFETDIYKERLGDIRKFLILFVAVMVMITLILCLYISVKIFNPITTIIKTIETNKNVLFGGSDILHQENEIKYIVSSIEKTVDKNKNIEDELAKRINLLRKAQSIALQSQINPHFLNNTLESVNWMAIGILGKDNNISNITNALSKMLRLALDNTDTIIPFSEELNHAKMYIEIQMTRYMDKFDIYWDVEDEIMNCKTIKIILQPIIENAIYHGIKPLSNKGEINVKGKIFENQVHISITDNGLGLSTSELEEINKVLHSDTIKENNHIGLSNVNQRLKLYFGEEYGVCIESDEGIGTKVSLKFPYIT